ncbi:hypothetical protein GCM10023171_33420 [Microbacterium panaciterrae]|uniref:ABC transporter domain-containing protein n=1 Tax=Microbacterium panaciterrae TaxID=985759 RepID=A0ABP8PSP6_9MICO
MKAEVQSNTARAAAAKRAAARAAAVRAATAKATAEKAASARADAVAEEAKESAAKVAAVKASAPRATPARRPSARTARAAEEIIAPEEAAPIIDQLSPSTTPAVDDAPVDIERGTTAPIAPEAVVSAPTEVVAPEPDVAPVSEVVETAAEPDAPAGHALVVRGLVKRFGDSVAVDRIDLTVPAGSFYGIVGPNGAGKTTTLSIIAGLLRPDAGTVRVSGIDQAVHPLAAKKVLGVLPDRLRTFDRLTGRQLLHYYGLLRGLPSAVVEKRVADLARAFDLTGALSRVVSDYSAGMTKKIMLAGAMIHSPRVLVLDEPFESVDPVSSGVILDILRAYVAHGGTVVLSSHGMDLVERVCSRIAIIVGGEVLAEGTVDEVRAGQTLEQRFVELSGSAGEVEGLEWLHTFSD